MKIRSSRKQPGNNLHSSDPCAVYNAKTLDGRPVIIARCYICYQYKETKDLQLTEVAIDRGPYKRVPVCQKCYEESVATMRDGE